MERFEDFEYDAGYETYDEGFVIDSAKKADWAISKIADERKRKDFFVECAKAEIEKLQNQIKDAEKKCDNATSFLTSCLGKFIERDDVPAKETKTQVSLKLPAGKIVKKLPKVEYIMANGDDVTKRKGDANFLNEIREINPDFIKIKSEIDWSALKKNITTDDDGNVLIKDTGEYIESLSSRMTLPEIEIKTE